MSGTFAQDNIRKNCPTWIRRINGKSLYNPNVTITVKSHLRIAIGIATSTEVLGQIICSLLEFASPESNGTLIGVGREARAAKADDIQSHLLCPSRRYGSRPASFCLLKTRLTQMQASRKDSILTAFSILLSPMSLMMMPYQNTVLVTGSTEFLGKVLLAELLRLRACYSIKMVVLLIRRTETMDVVECLHEAESTGCFDNLRPFWKDQVRVVEGDLTHTNCGLNSEDYHWICATVTHIIHASGYMGLDGNIHEAISVDVDGSLHILALAKNCLHLQQLVATSTAYVTPPRDGPIYEQLGELPRRAEELIADLRSHRITQAEVLAQTGHPSIYSLSKCLAEHMLCQSRGCLPLSIVRPSIISAALDHPSPGWIDSKVAFASLVLGFSSGALRVVNGHRRAKLDIVPVDKVADCLIAEAFRHVPGGYKQSQARIVFSVATTAQSLTLEDSCRMMETYFGTGRFRYIGSTRLALGINYLIHHRLRHNLTAMMCCLRGDNKRAEKCKEALALIRAMDMAFAPYARQTYDFIPKEAVTGFKVEGYVRMILEGVKAHLI